MFLSYSVVYPCLLGSYRGGIKLIYLKIYDRVVFMVSIVLMPQEGQVVWTICYSLCRFWRERNGAGAVY